MVSRADRMNYMRFVKGRCVVQVEVDVLNMLNFFQGLYFDLRYSILSQQVKFFGGYVEV